LFSGKISDFRLPIGERGGPELRSTVSLRGALLLLMASACSPTSEPIAPVPSTGSISGRVRLDGKGWPDERLKRLEEGIQVSGFDLKTAESLRVDSSGHMADVYVAVTKGLKQPKRTIPARPVVIKMEGLIYKPRVVGIMTGQTLEFHNLDDAPHNPHDKSQRTPPFGRGMQPQDGPQTRVFTAAESAVVIKCDVHPWMLAWVHVSDHPFFAVTGADGRYVLDGLPPGDYEVTAWHERFKEASRIATVKVEAGKIATLDFEFKSPKP
jgi:plastocyanin